MKQKKNIELKNGHICINENNNILKGNTLINVKDKVIVSINDIVKQICRHPFQMIMICCPL